MIKGLDKLMRSLSPEGVQKSFDKPMKSYIKKVVSDAQSNAPSIVTRIENGQAVQYPTNVGASITGSYSNGVGEINVGDPEGPYIEFGTGRYASDLLGTYPKEWQDIAWDYYRNGKGNTIPAEYLYPAVKNNNNFLDQELQKALDKL